jgi:L-arabinose isomerase
VDLNTNGLKSFEIWFITGSQHLYGGETLKKVAEHSNEIALGLAKAEEIPVTIVFKGVLTSAEAIAELCLEANSAKNCIGLIAWMHTFSPARMWVTGLNVLRKPLAHLHTQHNRNLPWSTIDMDFMNLNQSAHGDREFGFIGTRMQLSRKIIVGFWQDDDVISEIGAWTRTAAAWHDAHGLKIARFGDNMRDVAVTEGDKVEAQIRLGYTVNGYGIGDLAESAHDITDGEIDALTNEYEQSYTLAPLLRVGGGKRQSLREAAKIELSLRAFLENGGFKAFTDTFEDLHGLSQLPGIAVQRLMADGYGFGAEGDWKTAALVRAMKVMAAGLPGGTSFMEHYTYDLTQPHKTLGAHMLEVCPSIADGKPSLEVHPLSIGGKADPVRAVFTARSGPAVNVSLVDVGNRFRMVLNEIDVIPPDHPLPKLPVARAVWIPRPNLKVAASAWMYAGGAHHTCFSQALTAEHLRDFAEIAGIEFLRIGQDTRLNEFKNELRWNQVYYLLRNGIS